MGQIIGSAAKPKRCNLNKLSQLGTPAAGEYILVSSDNSMNAAGQGNFDSYIEGDGSTPAELLPLKHDFSELKEAMLHVMRSELGVQCPAPITINAYDLPEKKYTLNTYEIFRANGTLGQPITQNVVNSGSITRNVIIPVDNIARIDAIVFKTSGVYGSCFVDKNMNVVQNCLNTTVETGGIITYQVPSNAAYYCFFSGTALLQQFPTELNFVLYSKLYDNISPINELQDSVYIENVYTKTQLTDNYVWKNGWLLPAGQSVVGQSIENVTLAQSSASKIFRVPIGEAYKLKYLAFQTTSGYGSVFTDEGGVILAAYNNPNFSTGTEFSVNVPNGAAFFYYCTSGSLQLYDYYVKAVIAVNKAVKSIDGRKYIALPRLSPYMDKYNTNEKNSLCLCAIKFRQEASKIPFQEGYLFHEMINSGSTAKYYFGTTIENAEECAVVDYWPINYVVAISPKDGTIIAAYHNVRRNLRVFHNGQNYDVAALSSDGESSLPKGWLYNSGVYFIEDGDDEYCIFAEYDSQVSDGQRLYIWKGKYPYTSPSDWETVFYKETSYNSGHPTAGSITHFHMIRQDPWTGYLYSTTGDFTGQFAWLCSTDNGETWTEIASDYNTSTKPSWALDGQPLRCINFIFTEDYIYFATDHGSNNTLCRISRGTNGIIDLSTREVLAGLPTGIAVNTLCYVENPNGLLLFTRIDTGFTAQYGKPLPLLFWSFASEKLITLMELEMSSSTWGGHRGKCYSNYVNAFERRPAMGFANDTKCPFDLIGASDGTGTIYYDIV